LFLHLLVLLLEPVKIEKADSKENTEKQATVEETIEDVKELQTCYEKLQLPTDKKAAGSAKKHKKDDEQEEAS